MNGFQVHWELVKVASVVNLVNLADLRRRFSGT
jgi:hypothetical protein